METNTNNKEDALPENEPSSLSIIFVLGGPGAGKGTQCALVAAKHGFAHLSLGDVLREEVGKVGSIYGSMIAENMREGRVGPKEITVQLLRNAVQLKARMTGAKVFLIDGFPRKLDQASLFEDSVCVPTCVLLLQCTDEILQERLQARARSEGRFDDNTITIGKRLQTFRETTSIVLDRYEEQRKLLRVDATKSKEKVLAEIETRLIEVLPTLQSETSGEL